MTGPGQGQIPATLSRCAPLPERLQFLREESADGAAVSHHELRDLEQSIMMGEEAGTGVQDSWVPWYQQVRLNTPCCALNHAFSLSEPYPIVV